MAVLGLASVASVATAAAPSPAGSPTYHKDVAPIVAANCAGCHRPGEAAPFPLLSYGDAKRRAGQIVDLTSRRIMPPWKPDGGDVHFVGERRLTDAQLATLKSWSEAGAPEGNPADAPPAPAFPEGWRFGTPDLVVSMPAEYTVPADGPDVYRTFVLPVAVPPGKYVRAAEYRPRNRQVVHHAVLGSMKRDEANRRLSAEPAGTGPGFKSGLNAPGDRLPGSPGIWVPGKDPLPLPDGYALPWPADRDLVLQLHLHPTGKPEDELSSVGLYLTDAPPTGRMSAVVLMNSQVDIPPGAVGHTLKSTKTIKSDVDVIGLFPHMHLIGRTCAATATRPDGSAVRLLSIPDWDFRWQGYYQCREPVRLPAGTRIDTTWTFDNSADNPAQPSNPPRRVRFGEGTTDEMGALVLDVIPAGKVGSTR
ncbi:MAG: Copper type ascorbate-dependent monooxygenase, C-terminal domain protein [Phycisphaerales bacterium]|nr:Copper type ascorbate-dependent monooxygenase, C-terminal domain protein [Phycisphaerales bacterium]